MPPTSISAPATCRRSRLEQRIRRATVFTVPSNIGVGNYYLLAKADVAAAVTESNETNNVKMGSIIAVGPDLVVPTLTTPSTAAAGSTISVSDTTKNQGAGSAPASTTTLLPVGQRAARRHRHAARYARRWHVGAQHQRHRDDCPDHSGEHRRGDLLHHCQG